MLTWCTRLTSVVALECGSLSWLCAGIKEGPGAPTRFRGPESAARLLQVKSNASTDSPSCLPHPSDLPPTCCFLSYCPSLPSVSLSLSLPPLLSPYHPHLDRRVHDSACMLDSDSPGQRDFTSSITGLNPMMLCLTLGFAPDSNGSKAAGKDLWKHMAGLSCPAAAGRLLTPIQGPLPECGNMW